MTDDRTADESEPGWRDLIEAKPRMAAWAVATMSPRAGIEQWCSGRILDSVDFTTSTQAYGASVSKQLVGMLAAQAAVDGRLEVEASVREYLPDLPVWADPVRVRHLLAHTAALPQPEVLAGVLGLSADLDGWSALDNAAVLAALRLVPEPPVPPGRAFSYDNTAYVLLAEVVAAVQQRAVPELASDLFPTLGMSSSRLGGPPAAVLPGAVPPPRTVGDGGLWTTASDLLHWLTTLNDGAFGPDVTALAQTPWRLDDGSPLDYAWGVAPRPAEDGTITYEHAGSWPGWSAMSVRNPAAGTAVAMLAASDENDLVESVARDVHQRLLQAEGGRGGEA